jgi:hypothetical protein
MCVYMCLFFMYFNINRTLISLVRISHASPDVVTPIIICLYCYIQITIDVNPLSFPRGRTVS